MRYLMIGVALAAVSVAAAGQTQSWAYFEQEGQPLQAGVVNADGAQLILKCDKPGKDEVYAVVVTREALVPPTANAPFSNRPVEYRFDTKAPVEDRWRFYLNSAVAIDKRPTKALTRFLQEMTGATKLHVRLHPDHTHSVEATFDVGGAGDAVGRVYDSC